MYVSRSLSTNIIIWTHIPFEILIYSGRMLSFWKQRLTHFVFNAWSGCIYDKHGLILFRHAAPCRTYIAHPPAGTHTLVRSSSRAEINRNINCLAQPHPIIPPQKDHLLLIFFSSVCSFSVWTNLRIERITFQNLADPLYESIRLIQKHEHKLTVFWTWHSV